MTKETLFISYNWNDGNFYADELESQLQEKFDVKRDKTQLIANDSLDDFMAEIASSDNVIIVLTEEYVKSFNCMLEMSYLVQQGDWEMKSMVLVIDQSIYKMENKLDVISYWNDYQKRLKNQVTYADYGKSILEKEQERVGRICAEVEEFLKGISRRKNPSEIAIVNEVIKKSDKNREAKKIFLEKEERFIKSFLEENGKLTIKELSEKSGKSAAYAHRMVSQLVAQGVLEKFEMGITAKYSLKK